MGLRHLILAEHARATLSFPRRRESIQCAIWHGVMGSRLRGNDS